MDSWFKKFLHRSKSDHEALQRATRRGLPAPSVAGPNRPVPAYDPHRQANPISYPEESFTNRVQNATIDQMTILVSVWRADRNSLEEPEVAASRLLETGKESKAHFAKNYSFALFTKIFEEKMNSQRLNEQVEIKYGKCGYFTHGGEHKAVRDQDDFEVAIQHLFLNHGNSDILKFIFQPEPVDRKVEREAKVAEARHAENDRAIGWTFFASKHADSSSPVRSQGGPESPISPLSITSSRTHRTSSGARSASDGGHSPRGLGIKVPLEPLDEEAITSSDRRPSIGSKLKRPWSRARIRKISYEERNVRWKTWYFVQSKVAYKRGGYDEAEEIDIDELEAFGQGIEDGEVEEQEEGEVEEKLDVSEEDHVVSRLQDLQKLPELTQIGDSNRLWHECCRMFNIDPTQVGVGEVVSIAGLKTKLYQYQAFGVYWQMITSRKLGGGFVGGDMGLGKTLSFLAYFVVERQLSVLWLEVQKSRKNKDEKHLRPDQHTENDRCPTRQKAGWIASPCASSSPTSKFEQKPGVRLACVPENLVRTWWTQWKTHVDVKEDLLNLTLVIDYSPVFDLRTTVADANLKSSQPRNKARLDATRYNTIRKDGKGDDVKIIKTAG